MTQIRGDDLEALRRALRVWLREHGEGVAQLAGSQLRLLSDELGRLAQSNDRLRRQNRRLRRKLAAATGREEPVEEVGDADGDEPGRDHSPAADD
jgi:hypothetical protein